MLFTTFFTHKDDAISEWDDDAIDVGIPDEIVGATDVVKKFRRHWPKDSKTRWARN